jgi:hypothetical protein
MKKLIHFIAIGCATVTLSACMEDRAYYSHTTYNAPPNQYSRGDQPPHASGSTYYSNVPATPADDGYSGYNSSQTPPAPPSGNYSNSNRSAPPSTGGYYSN